jgi:hypothetical protein
MRILVILSTYFLATLSSAAEIDCTTKTIDQKLDKNPKITWCGALEVMAYDNGIKYRRMPRFCEKFEAEFFSIKADDEHKFTQYCETIYSDNCYMVRIHDNATRQNMMGLTSSIIVKSIDELPKYFSLAARGIGRKKYDVGRLFIMELTCSVH